MTTGNFSACESGFSGPGHGLCGTLPDNNGVALVGLGGARVTAASMTKLSTCTRVTGALTAMDMAYKMPSGTAVPVSVAGQNLTLRTSGGSMIVTYRCDSLGEFCVPYEIKDFWLGMQRYR